MAFNLGSLVASIDLKDGFSAGLSQFHEKISENTNVLTTFGDRVTGAGAGVTGLGFAMSRLPGGFEEIGKMMMAVGGAQAGFGGLFTTIPRLTEELGKYMLAIDEAGGIMGILSKGAEMAMGSLSSLFGELILIAPIIAVIAAAAFALYTIWTENFGGIQDITMGVIGDISSIISGLIDLLKGVVIGIAEGLMPVFRVLYMVVKPVLDGLHQLAGAFHQTSDGSYNLGKSLAGVFFVMSPGITMLRILFTYMERVGGLFQKLHERSENFRKATTILLGVMNPIYGIFKLTEAIMDRLGVKFDVAGGYVAKLKEQFAGLLDPLNWVNSAFDKLEEKLGLGGEGGEQMSFEDAVGTIKASQGQQGGYQTRGAANMQVVNNYSGSVSSQSDMSYYTKKSAQSLVSQWSGM